MQIRHSSGNTSYLKVLARTVYPPRMYLPTEKTENPINLVIMYGKLKAVIGAKLGWGWGGINSDSRHL